MYNFFSSRFFSVLPPAAAAVFLFGISIVFSGCYTITQGTTMIGYLSRAISLEELAEDKSTYRYAENILFVRRVNDIRRFAMEELGLKESKNYTRYVELDRNYLATIVSASAKDSFTPYEWWFPVIGSVPYKGFFNEDGALREKSKLEAKDLDVLVRGVDAFSTLGWFRDPLYSYMKEYPVWELAELIIHELVHATVYINNQSKFNEGLAQFIGMEGARLYMERMGDEMNADWARHDAVKEDGVVFLAYIRGLIAELSTVYENSEFSREEKLKLKEEIISDSKKYYAENYDEMFSTKAYLGFSVRNVNNAYLDHYRLYYDEDTWFMDAYTKSGSDLKAYIAAAAALNNDKKLKKEAGKNPWRVFEREIANSK